MNQKKKLRTGLNASSALHETPNCLQLTLSHMRDHKTEYRCVIFAVAGTLLAASLALAQSVSPSSSALPIPTASQTPPPVPQTPSLTPSVSPGTNQVWAP